MRTPTTTRPICLGFRTAIQVHRMLSIDGIEARPSRSALPDQSPRNSDLDIALARLASLGLDEAALQPLHTLASSTTRCRASSRCKPHMCGLPLPASSFLSLAKGVLCVKPALAFVQAATLLPLPKLAELGYELCGTYRFDPRTCTAVFQTEPLVSCADIRAFICKHSRLNGARKAARALEFVSDGSASPRETKAAVLFALPKRHGGYGFGAPVMNYEVKASPKARAIAQRKSFRCDLCWPEAHVDVEYQSREFHEGEDSRVRDSRRANALMSMGFKVIAITNEELDSAVATDVIAGTIAKAVGKRQRKEAPSCQGQKAALRRTLGLPG